MESSVWLLEPLWASPYHEESIRCHSRSGQANLKTLRFAAPAFERDGFLVPLRNKELFSWCLARGFRVAVPQTLMSQGFYQDPVGAFLPSVLY
jgi:hypothetical protein